MNKNLDKTFRFRKFRVYVEGRKVVAELKRFTKHKFPKEGMFGLSSQLWRALDSFLLNIAEGSDRGSDKDFAKFLNQSHTSLNEVVACLDIALDNNYILKEEHGIYLQQLAGLVDQITAFRRTLFLDSKSVKQKLGVIGEKLVVNGQRLEVRKGFTLIELLIVIAITVILATAAVPIYGGLQVKAQLNENTSQIIQTIRTARERSVAGYNNSAHGVFFDINSGNDRYVLYQGSSYATRDVDYDREANLDSVLSLDNSSFALAGDDIDITFSKGLGVPNNIGNLLLIHNTSGNRVISVSGMGTVQEN